MPRNHENARNTGSFRILRSKRQRSGTVAVGGCKDGKLEPNESGSPLVSPRPHLVNSGHVDPTAAVASPPWTRGEEPIPKLCDEVGLQPTVFYRRQKEFFENGAAAFEQKARPNHVRSRQ